MKIDVEDVEELNPEEAKVILKLLLKQKNERLYVAPATPTQTPISEPKAQIRNLATNRWTRADRKLLKEMWNSGMVREQIARQLNRTEQAIVMQCYKMKLRRYKKHKRNNTPEGDRARSEVGKKYGSQNLKRYTEFVNAERLKLERTGMNHIDAMQQARMKWNERNVQTWGKDNTFNLLIPLLRTLPHTDIDAGTYETFLNSVGRKRPTWEDFKAYVVYNAERIEQELHIKNVKVENDKVKGG